MGTNFQCVHCQKRLKLVNFQFEALISNFQPVWQLANTSGLLAFLAWNAEVV